MHRVQLLPRLSAAGVGRILDEARGKAPPPLNLSQARERYGSVVSWAASGGSKSIALPTRLMETIHAAATKHGFPNRGTQADRAAFDATAGVALASEPGLRTGEALRDDVWAFIAVVLAPDVVAWRYPDLAPARFRGGVRNALQRTWVRAVALDRGQEHPERWSLLRELSEDAFVQIFERASLSADHRLARAIAEAWVREAERSGRGSMESVMRRAARTLRLRNEIMDVTALSDGEMSETVDGIFRSAAELPEAP